MQRAVPIYFTLAMIGIALTGCSGDPAYVNDQSRAISTDIDATRWNGPTIDYPGEWYNFRGEPKGSVPWYMD